MKPRFDTVSFLWLAVVLFVALTIAFLLPITPQDYWWYLRVGQDTLASGSVPRLDTFTFTRSGSPVDYQSWGAAVIFFLIHQLGGLSLTVLFRASPPRSNVWAGLADCPPGRGGAAGICYRTTGRCARPPVITGPCVRSCSPIHFLRWHYFFYTAGRRVIKKSSGHCR